MEFTGARAPQQFFQLRVTEPVSELRRLPERLGQLRTERGIVERNRREPAGDLAEGFGGVSLQGGIERLGRLERGEQMGPAFPRADEGRGRLKMIELRKHEARIVRAGDVGVPVGNAGRQIVGLVQEQQGAAGIEARPVIEKAAIARGEDVVVVADPDVVEGEGGAGDFIRANPRGATRGAQGGQIARLVFKKIKPGQAALRPALLGASEKRALVADTVKDIIDTMLALVAHLPDRHRGGGTRRHVTCWVTFGRGRLRSGFT